MNPTFVHHYEPGHPGKPTLLLLHGTGGTETDLIPLGRNLYPGAGLLGVRGKVLEHGMPRFFRRLAEGVFDQEDLALRTVELADYVGVAATEYGFDAGNVVAVGYSNGANIAASILFTRPQVLRGAILLRAMIPFLPPRAVDMSGRKVLLLSGRFDTLVPEENAGELAQIMRDHHAQVDHIMHEAGHQLLPDDIRLASAWLADHLP